MKKNKKLFLVDGHGLIYRAYFALPRLSTSYGQLINAAYGFSLILIRLLQEYNPDSIIVAFDSPQPTFRHKKYPDYKAQREKMPQELIDQLPIIKEIVDKFNIPNIAVDGYEADDIIGTLVEKAKKGSYIPVIVTGDRDLLQLIDDHVEVLLMQKGITQVKKYNMDSVKDVLGFSPDMIPDYIGLKGDPSDNIPGIMGIGEKTAKKLIQEYGHIENLFDNIENLRNKTIKNKILNSKNEASLSKSLATIYKNIKIDFEFNDWKKNELDYEKLRELFEKYDFKNLIDKLPKNESHHLLNPTEIPYQEIQDEKELEKLILEVKKRKLFSILIHTKESNTISSKKNKNPIIAIALDEQVYLFRGEDGHDQLNLDRNGITIDTIRKYLHPLFQDEDMEKIGVDFKNLCHYLCTGGRFVQTPFYDLMISGYLLNPSRQDYSLAEMAREYLPDNDLTRIIQSELYTNETEILKMLAAKVKILEFLKVKLFQKMSEFNLKDLFFKIELPLENAIFQMERKGIKVDKNFLEEMSKRFSGKIAILKEKIFELAGEEFNLNSPKQLSCILFQKMKLPVIKKVKTGFSTDARVLQQLSEKHRIVALILEYRELEKLKNTYIDKLPKLINKKTGRIHSCFNQTGTTTGRLSSNNPNLQNIPTRTELGRDIRNAFISEEGTVFLSADYSQIELRVLAHLSKDEQLLDAFKQDKDIHTFTAAQIFNISQSLVTEEMRRIAKTINFGIIYGMSSFGLANSLQISREDAQSYIDAYFQRYQKVKEYIEKQILFARENQYVHTMLNRIRYLDGINSPNKNIRDFFERTAVNTPIQGTAADIIKIAMVGVARGYEKKGKTNRLILQIHDELIFEIPEEETKEDQQMIQKIMESSLDLCIPLKVNFKTGSRWGQLE